MAHKPGEHRCPQCGELIERYMTSQQVQRLLGIGRTKLWDITHNGGLRAYRLGTAKGHFRWKYSDVRDWLENQPL